MQGMWKSNGAHRSILMLRFYRRRMQNGILHLRSNVGGQYPVIG